MSKNFPNLEIMNPQIQKAQLDPIIRHMKQITSSHDQIVQK